MKFVRSRSPSVDGSREEFKKGDHHPATAKEKPRRQGHRRGHGKVIDRGQEVRWNVKPGTNPLRKYSGSE